MKTMKVTRHALVVIACAAALSALLVTPAAIAQDAGATPPRETVSGPKLDALLADVARARKGVKTLRASFVQERRIMLLATTVKSTGQLTFLAPSLLRWDLAPPDDIAYFVGPDGVAYRTKSSSASVPAAGANIARSLADLRALLGGDLAALGQRYVLEGSRGESDVAISGVAKDPKDATVRAFTIVLDKTLVVPLRARLVEGKTDSIELTFSNAVVNGPVNPAEVRP